MSDQKNFNSIVPDQDERIGARGSVSSPGRQPNIPTQQGTAPRKRKGRPGLWKFLVFSLIFAVSIGGWYGWQQHQQLALLQSNFDQLTGRLASTDDSLSKSGDALLLRINEQNETLKKHWSEIRKLWGVSNDRNKKKIEKNEKTMITQATRLTALEKSTSGLDKVVKQSEQNSKQITGINGTLLSANVDMEALQQQLQSTVEQLNRMQSDLETWQGKVNGRLSDTDEAIESIDTYRRQINQELLQLRQQGN